MNNTFTQHHFNHNIDAQLPNISHLLCKATTWRLLGLLWERPRPHWCEEIRQIASEIKQPLFSRITEIAQQTSEGTYLAIFGPGGQITPRQVSYCGIQDPGRNISELLAFYQAFLFTPSTEDPPDHIAVEVSFISYLLLKEAYALAQNANDDVQITRQARKSFVSLHLLPFVSSLHQKICELKNVPPHIVLSTQHILSETSSPQWCDK
jgi:nitrate reductase assembly molybdenum cofactor insertion protein NarJ